MDSVSADHMEPANGIVTVQSAHLFDETLRLIEELLTQRGIKLFAIIDHSGEAREAGLEMPPTKLIIFGNPRLGTPMMLAFPSSAIDLPLKILVAEDASGDVHVSYNSPAYLKTRHAIPDGVSGPLGAVEALAMAVIEAAS